MTASSSTAKRRTTARPLLRVMLLCPLALTVAAGCTNTHQSVGDSTTSTRPGGHISTASPEPGGKPVTIPTSGSYKVSTPPGSSKGYVGAAQDVKVSTCQSSNSATTFAGTVTNPTTTAQSYRIYVAVTLKNATVGVEEVDVNTLAARASSPWHGSLGTGADGAACVLRVERTPQG